MESAIREAERSGVMGVTQPRCVTGGDMFGSLDRMRRMNEGESASKYTNPKLNDLLEKLSKKEKEVYKKTGYYITGEEVKRFFERRFFVADSWENIRVRNTFFGGKANPEIEGAKYLIGFDLPMNNGLILFYVPYTDQKEPCTVFTTGNVKDRSVRGIVKAYSEWYNKKLDGFLAAHEAIKGSRRA